MVIPRYSLNDNRKIIIAAMKNNLLSRKLKVLQCSFLYVILFLCIKIYEVLLYSFIISK